MVVWAHFIRERRMLTVLLESALVERLLQRELAGERLVGIAASRRTS